MKVKELMEALSRYNADDEVHFAYPANDYWRNTLAPAVSRVEVGEVAFSGYHRCDQLPESERDADDAPRRPVVVLR